MLVLVFSLCVGLISCENFNNPGDDNPGASNPDGDNQNTNQPFNVDLAGCVANIGNATALGISKKAKASATPMASYGTNKTGIRPLSYNTFSKTIYYQITVDENGVPKAVNSETYVAPERNVITLQPLNK